MIKNLKISNLHCSYTIIRWKFVDRCFCKIKFVYNEAWTKIYLFFLNIIKRIMNILNINIVWSTLNILYFLNIEEFFLWTDEWKLSLKFINQRFLSIMNTPSLKQKFHADNKVTFYAFKFSHYIIAKFIIFINLYKYLWKKR